ncbi:MAG: molybdopterin-dependent oxidoreductase [Deltaproteobacteria bacterium]|nr:molybdopterin-dependent oxidoreductase [Deltaproteobacteria bacterium]
MEKRTTCNRDCPDSCGIVVTVEHGKAVRHVGDPAHGVTRGFLCSQGRDYLQRQYHPERVLYPQRRTQTGWERLSWDEALELAADKLRKCKAEAGPLSVLAVTYSGFQGHVQKTLAKLFWAHFGGATSTAGGLSVEPIHAAQHRDFGKACTHAPEDLVHSRAFVVWGKNLAVTRQHWIPFMDQARKNGARTLVIDPIPSATARRAERHFAIRPGSDRMLAIGIARLLLERDAIDAGFVSQHTQGFDTWRAIVMAHTLDQVSTATDLPLSAIEEIAEVYATAKPVSTLIGLGTCYWTHGGETVRFIDALAAVTGNLGVPGGGVSTDISSGLSGEVNVPASLKRTVRMPVLGSDILATRDPALAMGWVAGANPVAAAPDSHRVREGLKSLEFLVVVDQFMTATAEQASLFLPCTTYLEADDVVTSYGHHWVGLTRKVVEPWGEAKSDAEIYQGLANRLGFGDALDGSAESWTRKLLGTQVAYGALLRGSVRLPGAQDVPFADFRFGTPSGKFEFVGACTSVEQVDGLHLVATKSRRMINSQALPEDLPEEPEARVHPSVLAACGMVDGQRAMVVSPVGKVQALLRADDTLRGDVVVMNPARWKGDLIGVNQLREAKVTDLGCGAAMHETRVQLKRIERVQESL